MPDYVPPPFEVPVRIECICKRCSCIFCNKDGKSLRVVAFITFTYFVADLTKLYHF